MWIIAAVLAVVGAGDPDAPVSTAPDRLIAPEMLAQASTTPAPTLDQAPSAAHGLSTEQQIDRWLAVRARDETPAEPFAEDRTGPRRVQGELSVGVGTGGYRDYGGSVIVPLGDRATLGLSYRQVENGYGAYPYGYVDPDFADSGYAFPGATRPGQSLEHERRAARPDGPPNLRPLLGADD